MTAQAQCFDCFAMTVLSLAGKTLYAGLTLEVTPSTMLRTGLSTIVMLLASTVCVPGMDFAAAADPRPASPAGRHAVVNAVPESAGAAISTEKITHDVVGRMVKVEELTGAGPATEWRFEADEFRRVDVIERTVAEDGITLVVFMTSTSNRQADEDDVIRVSGKLLLHYERTRGQWILKEIENLTFRYALGVSI